MISIQKKTIHIFGNPLLNFDNLPLKLAPRLQELFPEIDFIITDPNENLEPINKELIIIDTVEGIENVKEFDDIKKLEIPKSCSMHDFDLAFNLMLLQKIGKLEKIKIIGVPMKVQEKKVLEQIAIMINRIC